MRQNFIKASRIVRRNLVVILICILFMFTVHTFMREWRSRNDSIDFQNSHFVKIKWELVNKSCRDWIYSAQPLLTAESEGRLGNQMFSYAALFAFTKMNPSYNGIISPKMSSFLVRYFDLTLCPSPSSELYVDTKWKQIILFGNTDFAREKIKNSILKKEHVRLVGYPESWKYFKDFYSEIRREFKFRGNIKLKASAYIKELVSGSANNRTIIGVHIRRSDYIRQSQMFKINLPTVEYFEGAMRYFAKRYPSTVFIFVSDDIPWCKDKFSDLGYHLTIRFLEDGTMDDAGVDLAVLASCDHVIFGVGTFGWWGAFLSGGEVVYCSDCVLSQTKWMNKFSDYGNFVLPNWKGFNRRGMPSSVLAKWNSTVSVELDESK